MKYQIGRNIAGGGELPEDKEGSRVTAQRKARIKAGWTEIKVWAASHDDVQKIREFSEELRMNTLRHNIRQIGRSRNTPPEVIDLAVKAISNQGSNEYTTPSGATLTLLTGLAQQNRLNDLNAVVDMFRVAHPGNVRFVSASVPAKVMSSNVPHRLDLRAAERIMRWQSAHPDWAKQVEAALETFTLEEWAERAVAEMQAIDLA
ncbi:hypothetical protein [Paraburkholderia tagetis]|uniref:Uncharacterized protein n=1 Tax=Paraburkholderia tagetis TaxID=2913261 RepID=A0A9X1RWI8_9BURK|nr:hypothetical protein [Paraburkholderia tagetis]MCG5076354.1 hypothetical protein [Paraburkholderia tagetis]